MRRRCLRHVDICSGDAQARRRTSAKPWQSRRDLRHPSRLRPASTSAAQGRVRLSVVAPVLLPLLAALAGPAGARGRIRARAAERRRRSTSPTGSSITPTRATASRFRPRRAPDGIVRRIEVRALRGRRASVLDRVRADQRHRRADGAPARRAAFPLRRLRRDLARPRLDAHRHNHRQPGHPARARGSARRRRVPRSPSIPARPSPMSPSCRRRTCRSSICGSRTPTRTRPRA